MTTTRNGVFDCDVERLGEDSELADTRREWVVSIDSQHLDDGWMQLFFFSEEGACAFQRAWRTLHGRDAMTGELS